MFVTKIVQDFRPPVKSLYKKNMHRKIEYKSSNVKDFEGGTN